MIQIYRHAGDSGSLCAFAGRDDVRRDEVVLKTKTVFGEAYTYAEPATPGSWAFGGSILYTSNGCFPEFCGVPVKLHDYDLTKETAGAMD